MFQVNLPHLTLRVLHNKYGVLAHIDAGAICCAFMDDAASL